MNSPISIIIPVLNHAALLATTLESLQVLRQRGHEVLVVDGGSRDGSVTVARKLADRVLMSGPGRAQQMDAGAESASHEILLFLHPASHLPADADTLVAEVMQVSGQVWGCFDLRLSGEGLSIRVRETLINWRSGATGFVNGKQALFVARTWFERVGGYGASAEAEDTALSRKLKRHVRPVRISARVLSDG